MLVTVRFPLLLISIPVRFALHLSLWSMSNLRSCLHVFVLHLLLSACAGSWLSVQVVLVAAVLLLRSLLAAPSAALVLLQRPWLLQCVLFLATSAGASFGCLCGALFLLLLWALLSAASTGAFSCLLLRMLLRWLLLRLLFSRDCFRCCLLLFFTAHVVLGEGEAPRWPPKLSSSWKLDHAFLDVITHVIVRDLTCP